MASIRQNVNAMKRFFFFTAVLAAAMAVTGCAMEGYFDVIKGDAVSSELPEDQGGDRYDDMVDNPFVNTADNNVSTFSVDADGASYGNMRRYVNESIYNRLLLNIL